MTRFGLPRRRLVNSHPVAHNGRVSAAPPQVRELREALKPLTNLNENQVNAVALAVLASHGRIDVDEHTPTLKQFPPNRDQCFDKIASYAMARKECKKAEPILERVPEASRGRREMVEP